MEHKNESNILITSAGRRFELVEIWQKAVRSFLGSNSKVIACDMNPFESAACQIADDYFEICSVKEINFVDQLLEICIQKKIKLIIPTIDTELLMLSKVRIQEASIYDLKNIIYSLELSPINSIISLSLRFCDSPIKIFSFLFFTLKLLVRYCNSII